jgi:hypothetical protein
LIETAQPDRNAAQVGLLIADDEGVWFFRTRLASYDNGLVTLCLAAYADGGLCSVRLGQQTGANQGFGSMLRPFFDLVAAEIRWFRVLDRNAIEHHAHWIN